MDHKPRNSHSAKADVLLRSAAVARMADMPVATLRIWEQRYGLASSEPSPAKHRLYSPQDVQRVVLLRQLTQQGHAIGSLAHLDVAQLQGLRAPDRVARQADAPPAMRLAVVGQALSLRLQRPAVAQALMGVAPVVRVWESMDEALQERGTQSADLLLWHAPELQPSMLEQVASQVRQVQQGLQCAHAAIIFRFAASKVQQALRDTQILAIREPADDEALVSWLMATHSAIAKPAVARPRAPRAVLRVSRALAPRRYDDAALTTLAGLSPRLACECPTHLAQLLMQLSSFERYSALCVSQSPADAELHAFLQHTAGSARAMLETALERVAEHEGLSLPAGPGPVGAEPA